MPSFAAHKKYTSGSASASVRLKATYTVTTSAGGVAVEITALQPDYDGTTGSGDYLESAKNERQVALHNGIPYSISFGGETICTGNVVLVFGTIGRTMSNAHPTKAFERTHAAQTKALAMTLGGTAANNQNISIPAKASYTISYNSNGGSGTVASQTKWYGESLTLRSNSFSKTNYSFNATKSWNTKSDSSGTRYAPGGSYTENAARTLYAIWNPILYFNGNGGSLGSVASSIVKGHGSSYTLPTSGPTRTNYTFYGWGTSATASSKVTSVATTDNATHTYYALWNPIIYFNANGGNLGSVASSYTKTYNGAFSFPTATPTRTNYSFKHWGSTTTSNTAVTSVASTDNTTHTFYAIWNPIIYFNGNGGTISGSTTTSKIKSYDETLSISNIIPQRENYRFLGWAESSTGDVQYTDSYPANKNTTSTLYAKWQQIYDTPTINIQQGYRSDSQGNSQDDGTYVTVKVNWSVFDMTTVDNGTPLSPTITLECYDDSNTLISNATVSVQLSSSANRTQVLTSSNANLNSDQLYIAKVSIDDGTENEGHIKTASVEIPTAFYPIDILRGGKGVAFGGAATQQGLMDIIGYDILIHQDLFFDSIDNNQSMESTNYKLYAAIDNLGWTSEVIE